MRPRQPFVGLALAALLGIAAAERWPLPVWPLLAALAAGAAVLCWRPRTSACLAFVAASFFALHTLRFQHDPGRAIAALLESGPRVVHAAGIVCAPPTLPESPTRRVACRFPLRLESLDLPASAADVVVNVTWAGEIPSYGDRVSLTGSAHLIEATRNPGQFDFTRYLQRQGIWSEIEVGFPTDGTIESHGHGSRIRAFGFAAQDWIQRQLASDLGDSPEIAALVQSMVLGLRGETPDDARELFQRTGTLHLFAVSGLNVAMLAGIVLAMLRCARITGTPAVAITIPVLVFYAIVTGLSASCVRATIMGSLILLAPVFDRRAVTTNSICAAAVFILAWDTNQLFAPGFQFSFVLVLAIVFLARRIERIFLPIAAPDPFLPRRLWNRAQRIRAAVWRLTAAALGVTFSAWIGSLAFTAGYFHLFSPAAIVANLVAVPLAFIVLALGVAALCFAPWWHAGAVLMNNANWCIAHALLAVIRAFALIPGGHVYVELPRPGPAPACEATIFDLRDGGAIHLRAGGHDWLVDCGSAFAYEHTVLPALRSRGVNRLDALVLTHGDSHHIGGALIAIRDFRPHMVLDSVLADRSPTRRSVQLALASQQRGRTLGERGDILRLGPQTTVRVLFPPGGLARSLADDKALVLQLESAGTRVLFMADSGFSTEQWLLENEPDLRADVLVKGHHSRDLSGTPDFIARVQPRAIVCGQLDIAQSRDALDEWTRGVAARGIETFRQDATGAVTIKMSADGALEVRGFVNGQTFRSRAR
jgi:ComEC/Rec2-related protein